MIFDFLKLYTFWKLRGIINDNIQFVTTNPEVYKLMLKPEPGKIVYLIYTVENKKYYIKTVYVHLKDVIKLTDTDAINYIENL